MDKRTEAMQDYINKAFGAIQRLTIQSTESNASAISEALSALRIVYNTLEVVKQEQTTGEQCAEGGEQDGRVSEAEG